MSEGLVTQHARRIWPEFFEPHKPDLNAAMRRLGADPSKADPTATGYDQFWKLLGYPEDWRELARTLANQKPPRSLDFIWAMVMGVYSPRHPTLSEVHRAIDPDGAEKHAQHQRDYCKRHPERRAQTQAVYYARNREVILAKRRERRQAKRNNPSVPKPAE